MKSSYITIKEFEALEEAIDTCLFLPDEMKEAEALRHEIMSVGGFVGYKLNEHYQTLMYYANSRRKAYLDGTPDFSQDCPPDLRELVK